MIVWNQFESSSLTAGSVDLLLALKGDAFYGEFSRFKTASSFLESMSNFCAREMTSDRTFDSCWVLTANYWIMAEAIQRTFTSLWFIQGTTSFSSMLL